MTDDDDFTLVMPFVVVASEGGPYGDDAFAAGFMCGEIGALLAQGVDSLEQPVRSAAVPQLDLIAMHHGYVMKSEPWDEHPDEWTHVEFTRATPLTSVPTRANR